jgi:5'-phosphate synthase pdxT subunit
MELVGVLALQGGFGLHSDRIRGLGYEVREVRDPGDLEGLGALILPGGESTTLGLLLGRRGLDEALPRVIRAGLPVFGTCAGAILLASVVVGSDQYRLGTFDLAIQRNAYGSQVDSFETELDGNQALGGAPLPAVFIRAPRITGWGPGVEVLARHQGDPVLVRQGTQVAATFHPELTASGTIHRWFLETVAGLPAPVQTSR